MGVVLVVDDDPIVLMQTGERLEALGYEVETREKVLGTASWVMKHQPILMLLDVHMPALSGSELADLLRRRGIDTPFILHSGKDTGELAALAKSTGALGSIPKGLTDEQFNRVFTQLARAGQVGNSQAPNNRARSPRPSEASRTEPRPVERTTDARHSESQPSPSRAGGSRPS